MMPKVDPIRTVRPCSDTLEADGLSAVGVPDNGEAWETGIASESARITGSMEGQGHVIIRNGRRPRYVLGSVWSSMMRSDAKPCR